MNCMYCFLLLHNKLPQTQQLKTTSIYNFKMSVGKKSGDSKANSSAQDLTGLKFTGQCG